MKPDKKKKDGYAPDEANYDGAPYGDGYGYPEGYPENYDGQGYPEG